tara:strand:+ start:226 stop:516 length:291 start_codon:yes stop_codon:yes gene_type:complete
MAKKATNKEITQAIIDINGKLNHLYSMIRGFDSIFTIYLEQKGDKAALEKKLNQLEKENEKRMNEQKANGRTDKPNLQGNTKSKSSGTKGIRQTAK